MDPRLFLGFMLCIFSVYGQNILFESGISLATVNPNSLPNPTDYEDVQNTGSYLFDSDTNEKKRISLSIVIQQYKSPTARYFRAHPTFLSCIQKVFSSLKNQQKDIMIVGGFMTKTDANGNDGIEERYRRSGTGLKLGFKPGVIGDSKDIAEAALKSCPVIFQREQRNIGIILLGANMAHIHMTSDENASPYFAMNGYTGMTESELNSWALNQIDMGIDPQSTLDCSKIVGLDNAQTHPSSAATPEEAVGSVDEPITRDTPVDFARLVQYQGRNIEFENNERHAAWCGKPGVLCVDCRAKPLGNSLNQRCANRVMSQRMYSVVNRLQKLVRAQNEKLIIEKAWDEKYTGHVNDFDATSLHTEGRLVVAKLSSGNSKLLSQLAICSKAEFVQNKGDHIIIGVRKMQGYIPQTVKFPEVQLLRVEPPSSKKSLYELPKVFKAEDEEDYPLIDSNGQAETLLADYTKLKIFLSKDPKIRYLRLNPLIAQCYSLIVFNLNKHNTNNEILTNIDVVRGFMSSEEQLLKLDPNDKRYNTMNLGTGFEIRYSNINKEQKPLYTLIKPTIDYCGPLFLEQAQQEIGIGIYNDRIFVDLRSAFDLWTKVPEMLPSGKHVTEYREEMLQRFEQAVENRIVDPDDLEEACLQANLPKMQSPLFEHVHPEHVQRRRRSTPDPEDCIPEANTDFCTNTVTHRQSQVNDIWTEVLRKPIYKQQELVKAALEGCFLTCGTCLNGKIYEDKSEHCNNFLHWAPFDLMNDEPGVTNMFPRDSVFLRQRACAHGHCIVKAPLHNLVVPAATAIYRPDITTSRENEIYPQTGNPNPIIQLLSRLYSIHASGTVKFWVKDEVDMLSLLSPLEVVMLYNKNVTDVKVFVHENSKMEAVEEVIQTAVQNWANIGCPKLTREIIAPFEVLPLPKEIGKRSLQSDIREEIIHHYTNWESRWVNRDI